MNEEVLERHKPILGICLGMQVMAKKSYELGEHQGLGRFDAEITRLTPSDLKLRIPHVGCNNTTFKDNHFLFQGLPANVDLYFVHSFYMNCKNADDIIATCDYGEDFTAAVQINNIIATQFHPEKSQDFGLTILENFCNWNP